MTTVVAPSPGFARGFPLAGDVLVEPRGLLSGAAALLAREAGFALPLAGGPLAFTACRLLFVPPEGAVEPAMASVPALQDWVAGLPAAAEQAVRARLDALVAPRPPFAGLALDRPRLMGVVNVTPDSFSDGGQLPSAAAAIAHGLALAEAGADVIDVGGESTRPGAAPTPVAAECDRVLPVVAALSAQGLRVSIDTRRAAVMAAALDAGAAVVNDVTALRDDPDALPLVAARRAPVVLMHMQGAPATMQRDPRYRHAPADVFAFLAARVAACRAGGIPTSDIAVDPGIGFGKTVRHNAELLDALTLLHGTGCAVLLGASRKGFIGMLSKGEAAQDRLAGTLAAVCAGVAQGVQFHRVHDVAAAAQALAVLRAVCA
ncbi:MAG: dihydropteroate synthase [Rhodospirillales bacterium]